MTDKGIGARVLRNEDDRLLNGRGQYLGDISVPGCQEVCFLRSPVDHGRILGIEVPEGTEGRVFTSTDLGGVKPIRAVGTAPGFRDSDYPPLAVGKVRFAGEPVAMCVAPPRAEAEDLAQRILVDYEELPAVVDMDAALQADAAKVHETWPDNLVLEIVIDESDLEAAAEKAAVRVTGEYRLNRHAGAPLEGRGSWPIRITA